MRFNIKYAFAFIINILLFAGCNSEKENSFIISGRVPTLHNNYILLSKINNVEQNEIIFIDSLKVNKRGEFNAVYFLEPAIYSLNFDNKRTILIAANKGQNINIKGISIEKIKVGGSKDSKLLYAYQNFRKESLNRLVKTVRTEIKNIDTTKNSAVKIAKLRETEVENYKIHLNELIDFVKNEMGTSIAVYATSMRWNTENLPFLEQLVIDFSEEHPNLEITKKLEQHIQLLEKTAIGSVISNIELPDSNNKTIKLNNLKNKYTLINFWASWCPPCRTESAALITLYNTYNTKGFNIYDISLDTDKNRWLKAIKKDNRTWTSVSALKGFKGIISKEYGITSLPTNFVINAEGKIIASNIHGNHLKELIEKLLK